MLAATQLGLTDAPVIVLGHLTEAQRRAYRIADNKLTELGTWDEALLSAELNDLLAEDFDLSLVGFSDGELPHSRSSCTIPRPIRSADPDNPRRTPWHEPRGRGR